MNTALLCLTLLHAALGQVQAGDEPESLLYVRTTPSGAQVTLDGKPLGTTDGLFPVAPGEYTIVVDLAGHEPDEETVTVRDGRITRIELKLRASPKVPSAEPPPSGKVFRARNFVRLVVGEEGMTFQGREAAWEEMRELLEAVPDPQVTVLEVAVASADVSTEKRADTLNRAGKLAEELGFEYACDIGVHPLGSMGSTTQGIPALPQPADPLIEIVITHDDVAGRDWLLDLDRGKLHRPAEANWSQKIVSLVNDQGFDLTARDSDEGALCGLELQAARIRATQGIEHLGRNDVSQALGTADDQVPSETHGGIRTTRLAPLTDAASAYAFRTREGTPGVLRFVGGAEDEPGPRIQYKLFGRAAGDGATKTPEAACRKLIADFVDGAKRSDKNAVAECLSSNVDVGSTMDDTNEVIAMGVDPNAIRLVNVRGDWALVVTEFADVGDRKYPNRMAGVYTLVKPDDKWLIEDIDLEDVEGLAGELRRFDMEHGGEPPVGRLTIDVAADGTPRVEKEEHTEDSLGSLLRQRVKDEPDLQVVLRCAGAAHRHVAALVDLSKSAGAGKISLTVAGPAASPGAADPTQRDEARAQLSTLEAALECYRLDIGRYPSSEQRLKALILAPDGLAEPDDWNGPYIRGDQVGVDPWGTPWDYTCDEDGGSMQLRSWGPDCVYGTDDDVTSGKPQAAAPPAPTLELRAAPVKKPDEVLGIEPHVVAESLNLRTPGPRDPGDKPYGWFELASEPVAGLITGTWDGRTYVLLSNRPGEVLSTARPESLVLGRNKVSHSVDAQGTTTIEWEVDKASAERMKALTGACLQRPLAVVVDGRVIACPVVRSVISNKMMITGQFDDEEASRIVLALTLAGRGQ